MFVLEKEDNEEGTTAHLMPAVKVGGTVYMYCAVKGEASRLESQDNNVV